MVQTHCVLQTPECQWNACYFRSRQLEVADGQSLLCFDRQTGLCRLTSPTAAIDLLSPRAAMIPLNTSIREITEIPAPLVFRSFFAGLGWWIGCVIGDGWVCSQSRVYLSGHIQSDVLPVWFLACERIFQVATSRPVDRTSAVNAWKLSENFAQ